MSADPQKAKKFGLFCHHTKDWSVIELIRSLSNVSIQFRKEFGNVFWRRTKIKMDNLDPNNDLVADFFKERPAVTGGIRRLEFELSFADDSMDPNSKKHQRGFLNFLQTIS